MVSKVNFINGRGSGSAIVPSNTNTKDITVKLPSASGTLALEGGPSGGLPPGTVVHGAYQTVPEGWLMCNGQSVSVAEYEDLYAAIGNVFGGDATNFNIPDLRGQFLRGWDDGKGVDPGRAFGDYQADVFGSHTHTDSGHSHGMNNGRNIITEGSVTGAGGSASFPVEGSQIAAGTANITASGGPETRPKNVALLPIIKF